MIDDWDELGFPAAPTKLTRRFGHRARCTQCGCPYIVSPLWRPEPCWTCQWFPLWAGVDQRAVVTERNGLDPIE